MKELSPEFWAQAAAALATFLAVFVALYGGRLQAWLFPVRLQLKLVSPGGEATTDHFIDPRNGQRLGEAPSRYYHVRADRLNRWPNATRVRVWLTGVYDMGPGEQMIPKWRGDVPLNWKHRQLFPLERDIGGFADCDLFSVIKGRGIQLHLPLLPNNLAEFALRPGRCEFLLSVQARGLEGESPETLFHVWWDGEWKEGEIEMRQHLVVKERPNA